MEGEAIVRAKSLVWLSGYSLGAVADEMEEVRKQRKECDSIIVQELLQHTSQVSPDELPEGVEQALTHLAGYLARSVLKVHKCEACHDLLRYATTCLDPDIVSTDPGEERGTGSTPALSSFTEYLDRGKLVHPSTLSVQVTTDICHYYRWLLINEDTKWRLFGCNDPKQAFQSIISIELKNKGHIQDLMCSKGHLFTQEVLPKFAGALFNVFTSNYSKEQNS